MYDWKQQVDEQLSRMKGKGLINVLPIFQYRHELSNPQQEAYTYTLEKLAKFRKKKETAGPIAQILLIVLGAGIGYPLEDRLTDLLTRLGFDVSIQPTKVTRTFITSASAQVYALPMQENAYLLEDKKSKQNWLIYQFEGENPSWDREPCDRNNLIKSWMVLPASSL